MNNQYEWYSALIKPSWSPPGWLFGPVWSVLYTLIAISFGKVFMMGWKKEVEFIAVLPFILNLVFNFAFTSIQFGLNNNGLASVDILLVWLTIIWSMIAIYPYSKWISLVQIPYLIWVTFASVLQLSITFLNK